jgi:hypothetical protein
VSTRAATIVEVLADPASILDFGKDPAPLSFTLPLEHSFEHLHAFSRYADGLARGHDADHVASGLELDLSSGLDPVAIGDDLGYRDL